MSKLQKWGGTAALFEALAYIIGFVGFIAVVNIGAATQAEMKEKKARVEDALHATRAAVKEGIVPGLFGFEHRRIQGAVVVELFEPVASIMPRRQVTCWSLIQDDVTSSILRFSYLNPSNRMPTSNPSNRLSVLRLKEVPARHLGRLA